MPRVRIPIWLLMGAILVIGLYVAGIRVLMEKRVGGPEQSGLKV